MNFREAFKRAMAEKKYLRRDAWSMGRPSIILDADLCEWFDAFGRPFVWSNMDLNAREDADDWMVVGAPT